MANDQDQPVPGLADETPTTVEDTTVATADTKNEDSSEIQSRSSNIDFVTLGMFIIGESANPSCDGLEISHGLQ